ncbi:ABC transporter permease [Amycolatopsis sp. FDAARGOS 1241]|uniref:ABC transporter permease n=1 Tax=Amycolatopsis sp. FDAARGOS 1241 TaxID=2778070 RepID=UPI001950B8AB|nr:ABC transporter permease [Amycolatopsis sp. FDAARGOS 1241]QRP48556.1 ABC transporter permease [Amycolatopsis sp. FDAARGOS 1241]
MTGRRVGWALGSPVALLLLWELCSRTNLVDSRVLPAPSAVLARVVELFGNGELVPHLEATLVRFAAGLALGVVAGVLVGLTMGLFDVVRRIVNPLIAVLYPLPRIAMFPLILILLGFNERANILEITLAPFFTMAISTLGAVLAIEPIYRDVAKSFETGTLDLYLRITLPAVLPAVIGGLRVSIGLALMSTTAVEFLAANTGLGYLIWHAWQILSLEDCLAAMVVAGVLGTIAYGLVSLLERVAVPWRARVPA